MTEEFPWAVTVSRQLGAGGAAVGQRLAARLGYLCLDREIIRLAAEQTGTSEKDLERWDERLSSFWERLIDSLAVGPPEVAFAPIPEPPIRDAGLFEVESRIIQEIAHRRSVVSIGRGAFWTLREHPRLVRIYLHAAPAKRVGAVREAFKLASDEEARTTIDRVDKEREKFIQGMTGRMMSDARNYDLSINTGSVGVETATELAFEAVKAVQKGYQV
ncbi:MAG: cytidylate kinase-like family protein [Phycisphaerales bacterium]|jgi:cytidylate kinase|nr:cytidylate kinase-like family protein [Phycisphaerales bacterium]